MCASLRHLNNSLAELNSNESASSFVMYLQLLFVNVASVAFSNNAVDV